MRRSDRLCRRFRMTVTKSERVLRTERAVLPGRPPRALELLDHAMQTRDPRFRNRIRPAHVALNRGDLVAADKWRERPVVNEVSRRLR
jgi:hypothetical protein